MQLPCCSSVTQRHRSLSVWGSPERICFTAGRSNKSSRPGRLARYSIAASSNSRQNRSMVSALAPLHRHRIRFAKLKLRVSHCERILPLSIPWLHKADGPRQLQFSLEHHCWNSQDAHGREECRRANRRRQHVASADLALLMCSTHQVCRGFVL